MMAQVWTARRADPVGIGNVEAQRLYESCGFRDRGPFGRYKQTSIATFMQIDL